MELKSIIGLLIFICVVAITVNLAVTKKIDNKLTVILLIFAICAGFVAANYDIIEHLKVRSEDFEVEVKTAKREIDTSKTSALAEIGKEVESQKESIRLLISNANDTSDKLEAQGKSFTELIDKATALQKRIEEQKQEVVKLNLDSQAAKKEIEKLNEASSIIALTLTKATYLTLMTKGEFGSSARLKKVNAELEKDINQVLPMVIPDPQERKRWIEQLQDILPKRQ
jgi:hypothetical protein